jgi:hypothetical protein
MYFAYADETGIDGDCPVVVMAAIVVNSERLTRTQEEFAGIFEHLGSSGTGNLKELKSKDLFAGRGFWREVDGTVRRNIVTNLCGWLCSRKHDLALAAIDVDAFETNPSPADELADIWQAAACHIALQLQRAHQGKSGSKGRTVLIFDDNKRGLAGIADLVHSPPAWTDSYYERGKRKPALDKLIDTPFAVQSHHVGLVQVADIFAGVFRRYAELTEYGGTEKYAGEVGHVQEWVDVLKPRLVGKAHRWPAKSNSACGQWYRALAPDTLLALG